MYCAIPRTVCPMQSWKRPVDCTTSETRIVSGGSKPNENLIPEKVSSFTLRQRFTPATACSTLTRTRANFRFVRFSASVSSPPGGFFFRPASFLDRWLVPLEPGVLVQNRLRRIGDVLPIHDLFLVRLAGVGAAQEADAFTAGVGDDPVLVGVRLLLAAVV